jgi:hypothetical protein
MRHLNPSHEISRLEPADVAPVLRECVARRTLALVLDLETEWLSKAEFAAFSDRSIMLEVFHATADCYPSASLASVAFVWGEQTRMFLAPVLGFHGRPAPEPSTLELEMPLEIASAMAQIRYRVPVFHDSGLDVKVIPDDSPRLVRAQAVNLSLTGILIEFAEGADPHFPVGAGLTIALSLGKQGGEPGRRGRAHAGAPVRHPLPGRLGHPSVRCARGPSHDRQGARAAMAQGKDPRCR